MTFSNDKAIYLQIADRIYDDILAGKYKTGDRIPSVREVAVTLEVNINTVMKAYDQLSRKEVVQTKRGMGYFVTEGAREKILSERKSDFMKRILPDMFRQMRLLGIGIDDVTAEWRE